MCVKLPPGDLNPDSYPLYSTSTYTYGVLRSFIDVPTYLIELFTKKEKEIMYFKKEVPNYAFRV